MKLTKVGEAGSADSGDILVTVAPNEAQGIQIELTGKAVILKQFGRQIKETIRKTVEDNGLENVTITAKDNAALDCTIKARVRAALQRAV